LAFANSLPSRFQSRVQLSLSNCRLVWLTTNSSKDVNESPTANYLPTLKSKLSAISASKNMSYMTHLNIKYAFPVGYPQPCGLACLPDPVEHTLRKPKHKQRTAHTKGRIQAF